MNAYEEHIKKAQGALILQRENEIITELRATGEHIEDKLESGLEVVNIRLDKIDKDNQEIKSLIEKLLEKHHN